jgi:hypothetical protein
MLGYRTAAHNLARVCFITPILIRAGCFGPFRAELVVKVVRPG